LKFRQLIEKSVRSTLTTCVDNLWGECHIIYCRKIPFQQKTNNEMGIECPKWRLDWEIFSKYRGYSTYFCFKSHLKKPLSWWRFKLSATKMSRTHKNRNENQNKMSLNTKTKMAPHLAKKRNHKG